MCSNREKSLVINNGSISIIIFVHTKKKQTTTTEEKNKMLPILYSHCDRADFHSALYIAFMGVLCRYCSILFPFFSSSFSFIYETHIKSRRCHSDLLFLLKTELYTINTNFLSHLEIVMFLCALLSIGVSVYAEYHPLCVR